MLAVPNLHHCHAETSITLLRLNSIEWAALTACLKQACVDDISSSTPMLLLHKTTCTALPVCDLKWNRPDKCGNRPDKCGNIVSCVAEPVQTVHQNCDNPVPATRSCATDGLQHRHDLTPVLTQHTAATYADTWGS